jgi:hypothetical protein
MWGTRGVILFSLKRDEILPDMILKKKNIIGIGFAISLLFTPACERFDPESILVFKTGTVEELPDGVYRLTGNIINVGSEEIVEHGFCWSTSENPTILDQVTKLGARETEGTFTSIITDLAPDMQFFVRAYVTTGERTEYGKDKSFRTPPPKLPEVATFQAVATSETTARCGGEVISDGGEPVIARGVCWSTFENPTLSDRHTTDGGGVGEFASEITGLNCSKEYFVRAYATNSVGTVYGNQVIFSTPECIPAEGFYILSDRDGTWIVTPLGEQILFNGDGSRDVEVMEGKIYLHWGHEVKVYDLAGNLRRSIAIDNLIEYAYKMCVLPGENMAFLDNERDLVSFTNSSGELLTSLPLMDQSPDDNLQSVYGVVVGNSLIISEDGSSQLVRIDLDNYQRSVFRNFGHLSGWLGDIDFADGTYYMVQSQKIFSFREGEEETLVCILPEGNNTGIAILGNFAYVTHGNKLYRVNLQNGSYEVLLGDLNFPEDIELIR